MKKMNVLVMAVAVFAVTVGNAQGRFDGAAAREEIRQRAMNKPLDLRGAHDEAFGRARAAADSSGNYSNARDSAGVGGIDGGSMLQPAYKTCKIRFHPRSAGGLYSNCEGSGCMEVPTGWTAMPTETDGCNYMPVLYSCNAEGILQVSRGDFGRYDCSGE